MILQTKHLIGLFLVLMFYCIAGLAQEQPATEAPEQAREPKPAGYFKAQRQLKNWWDEEAVQAALKLEAEQLARMNEAQEQFSQQRRKSRTDGKVLNEQLGEALVAGDAEQIAAISGKIRDNAAAYAEHQTGFKTGVLGLLNEQQLATLAARFPEVISDNWGVRTRQMTRARQSEGRGQKKQKEKAKDKQEQAVGEDEQ